MLIHEHRDGSPLRCGIMHINLLTGKRDTMDLSYIVVLIRKLIEHNVGAFFDKANLKLYFTIKNKKIIAPSKLFL